MIFFSVQNVQSLPVWEVVGGAGMQRGCAEEITDPLSLVLHQGHPCFTENQKIDRQNNTSNGLINSVTSKVTVLLAAKMWSVSVSNFFPYF